jgi:hypothetical protein
MRVNMKAPLPLNVPTGSTVTLPSGVTLTVEVDCTLRKFKPKKVLSPLLPGQREIYLEGDKPRVWMGEQQGLVDEDTLPPEKPPVPLTRRKT